MVLFCVPVCHDGVTVSQQEQHQDPHTEAVKWNSAVMHFNILYLRFTATTSRNVFCEKGPCHLAW